MRLIPKSWSDFQHYKDRSPPWIKLHKTILSDRLFMRLPLASKALAPLLWLLASESRSENGEFDASTEELEFRLHMTAKDIEAGRKSLIDKGFFLVASSVLADCLQPACLETETEVEKEERKRKEKEEDERKARAGTFGRFYSAYPKKESKKTAEAAFLKAAIVDISIVLEDIAFRSTSIEWRKDSGQFIPMPATYLNQRRWEDERNTSTRRHESSVERASPESFRERDARAGRDRWEEMTGEQHPDNAKQKPHSNILNVIDVATVKRIGASA